MGAWNPLLQGELDRMMNPKDGDTNVFRFMPEMAMDEKERAYFRDAMAEMTKIAMEKGEAAPYFCSSR